MCVASSRSFLCSTDCRRPRGRIDWFLTVHSGANWVCSTKHLPNTTVTRFGSDKLHEVLDEEQPPIGVHIFQSLGMFALVHGKGYGGPGMVEMRWLHNGTALLDDAKLPVKFTGHFFVVRKLNDTCLVGLCHSVLHVRYRNCSTNSS